MAITMIVNLFVVRVVLNALGIEDYGIYNIVAGTVNLLSFLSTSLSSGAQRFFAVDIGRKNYNQLKTTFSITFYIYGIIGLISVIFLETIGVWFLNYKLNIPLSSLKDANIVFQFAIISFLAKIFTIPYNAAVIAYERMSFFSYLSIVEVLARLAIAASLLFLMVNKMILYSALTTVVSIVILVIYIKYVTNSLIGCTIIKIKDFKMSIQLIKYSGWNMIGALANIGRNQGLTVLLNIFFSPIVSAAQTIGQQVYGAVNMLATNIYVASRPQITKFYSVGEAGNMWNLIFLTGKLACFLLICIIIPLIINLDFIMQLWLGEVPQYAVSICRCLLIALIIESFVNQIFGGFQAANKLKKVQSISSSILLLIIPLCYVILNFYTEVFIPYYIYIFLTITFDLSVVIIAKKEIFMSLKEYSKELFFPSFIIAVTAPIIPMIVHENLSEGWFNFILTSIVSLVCSISLIWIFGLKKNEKKELIDIIKKFK